MRTFDPKSDAEFEQWMRNLYKDAPVVKSMRDFKISYLKKLGAEL